VDLATIKDLSIIVAGIVAFIGLVSGAVEYRRRGRQERAQHFLDLRRRFLEDESFRRILNLLATDDEGLTKIPVQERRNLVGFLEEVALMVDSRLIRLDVAHYMYGYYVQLVAKSRHFWDGLDPESPYWAVFRQFADRLRIAAGEPPSAKSLTF
jgi:hypothetical protein